MYIFLGLISTGFMNKFSLIIFVLLLTIIIYMIVEKKIIIVNLISFLLLVMFEISYYTLLKVNDIEIAIYKIICPIIMYYCGVIIYRLKKGNISYITKCIIAISLGFFMHAMLNFATNIEGTTRNTIDIWSNNYLSATLQGTMLTMILSMLFYVYGAQKNIKVKIIYGICFVLAMMYLLVLGSRTQFLITAIVFIFEILLYNIINKNKEKIKKIFKIAIMLIIAIALYNINMFGIKDTIYNSNLYERLGKSATQESDENRFKTQVLALKSMIDNPWGNKEKIGNLNYAHNMWLDIGKEVGIIPAILLIGYTICTLNSAWRIIKSKDKRITLEYKILISSIFIGININFFVEPIMQGIPLYFIMFTFINGMVDAQYYNLRRKKSEGTLDSKHDISISSQTNRP